MFNSIIPNRRNFREFQWRRGRKTNKKPLIGFARLRPVTSGVVYLMHDQASNLYKIGYSASLNIRLRELRAAISPAIVVIHKIYTSDTIAVEHFWHRRFAEKRVGRAEWFQLTPADVEDFRLLRQMEVTR